jgi:hypothetical protein
MSFIGGKTFWLWGGHLIHRRNPANRELVQTRKENIVIEFTL